MNNYIITDKSMNKISVRLCGQFYARFIVAFLLGVISLPSEAQFTDLTFESGREQYLSSDGTKILPKTIFKIEIGEGYYIYDPADGNEDGYYGNDYKGVGANFKTSSEVSVDGYPDGSWPLRAKVSANINVATAYISNNARLWYIDPKSGNRVDVKHNAYRVSATNTLNSQWTIEPWEVSYFPSGVTVHLDLPCVYSIDDAVETKHYSSFEYEVVECAVVEKNSYTSAVCNVLSNAEAVIVKAPAVLTVNNTLNVNQLIVEGGNEYTASGEDFCLSAGVVVSNAGNLTVNKDAWFLGPENGGTKQIGWLINKGTYTSNESHFTRLIDNDGNFERGRSFGATISKNSSANSYSQTQYVSIPTITATDNSSYRIAPRGPEWNDSNYGFVKPSITSGSGKSVSNVSFYSVARDLTLEYLDAIKSWANANAGIANLTSAPTSSNYVSTNSPLVVYKQSGTNEKEQASSVLHFSHSEINDAASYNYVATDQYENSKGTYSILGSALYISNPYQAPIDWRAMAEGGVFDVNDVRNVTTQSFYGIASQTIYNVATGFTTYDGPMQYGYLQQPMSPAQLTTLAQDATPSITVSKDYLTAYRNVRNKYVGTTTAKCDTWPYVRFYVDDVDNPNGVGNRNVFVVYFLTQSQYDQYITEGYTTGGESKEHYPYSTPSGNLMINSLYEAKIAAGVMSDQFYANVPYIGAATQTEGESDAISERYPTVIKAVVYDESNDNVDPNCDVWFYIAEGEKNVEYGILDYGNIKSSGIGVKLGDLRLNVYEDGNLLSDITSANFDVSTGKSGKKALSINSNKNVTRVRLGNIETTVSSKTSNQYSVEFVDDDDITVLKESTLYTYGTLAADIVKPSDPTKASDVQYTYEFAGWVPAIADVTSNAIYTASYTSTLRQYSVTFVDEDGTTVLKSTKYDFGTSASEIVLPTTPTKSADAQYTYEFAGWNNAIEDVTGDVTYTATYTPTLRQYSVSFVDEDGTTELKAAELYDYGTVAADIVRPTDPTKATDDQYTYKFAGWDPTIDDVTDDVIYKATYTKESRKYTITFNDDAGNLLSSQEVAYGVIPVYAGETPSKGGDYVFVGWTPDLVAVTSDATYTAKFIENAYKVVFLDIKGDTLSVSYYAAGATIDYIPDAPEKASTVQYSYTFVGWYSGSTPLSTIVTKDVTYSPSYATETNVYNVTFRDYDGDILSSEPYTYGSIPVAPQTPTRASTEQYNYTFAKWTPSIIAVHKDAEYTAVYDSTRVEYDVFFVNGTDTLQNTPFKYGEEPVYSKETPTKESTAQYSYTFKEWSPELVTVTQSATYEAQFDSVVNKYEVYFVNGNNVDTINVEYGEMPIYSKETPTKESTAQYSYTFKEWSPELVAVTQSATYEAQFDSVLNKYEVYFVNGTDTLQTNTLEYGTMPEYIGVTPTKAPEGKTTFVFVDWTPEIDIVRANTTYEATFNAEIEGTQKFLISFVSEGVTLQSDSVAAGTMPKYIGETPTKAATADYTYDFHDWTPEIVAATADAIYTARFDSTFIEKTKYTITFMNGDEKVQESEVEEGEMPVCEKMPTKANTEEYVYAFKGWKPEVVKAIENATYYAQFDSIDAAAADTMKFVVSFVNGTSELQSDTLKFGDIPEYKGDEPTKESTESANYVFAGWKPEITPVVASVTYEAQFEEIPIVKNKYIITFMNGDEKLQESEVEEGVMPVCETIPSKERTNELVYAFVGWNPEVVAATANATYYAQFESMSAEAADTMKFVVSFVNDTVLQTDTLQFGDIPEYKGAEPTKASTAKYDFTFAGWNPMIVGVTKDVTYTAVFDTTEIIFDDCKAEINENAASVIFDKWILTINNKIVTDSIASVEWYQVINGRDDWCDGTKADDVRLASGKYFTGDSVLTKLVNAEVYAVIKLVEPRENGVEYIISNIINLTNTTVIAVAPTQARHGQTIRVSGLPSADAVIRVYNLYGTMVKNIKTNGDQIVTFEAEDSDGIYIVNVKAGEYSKSVKYIVK